MVDWIGAFRSAALALLSGASPYTGAYFSPPWIAALLIPFALFPPMFGGWLVAGANVVAYLAIGARWRIHPLYVAPLVYLLWSLVATGNIDGLCLLGIFLPPQLGLFLVLGKPQIGIGIAALWACEAWKDGRLIRTFAPVMIAFLASFAVYGWYLSSPMLFGAWWNRSLFPWSIPFGLLAMYFSLRRKSLPLALMVGPLLSPYVNLFTWAVVVIGFAGTKWRSK